MRNASLILLAAFTLMACNPEPATVVTTESPTDNVSAPPTDTLPPAADPSVAQPIDDPTADTCNMAQYASIVGQPATDPAVPAAGATVRHIRPDTQVTMDFQPMRLNIEINADGVITGVRCG